MRCLYIPVEAPQQQFLQIICHHPSEAHGKSVQEQPFSIETKILASINMGNMYQQIQQIAYNNREINFSSSWKQLNPTAINC